MLLRGYVMKRKIVAIIIALSLLGGGFYAYRAGLFSKDSASVDGSAEIYVSSLSNIMGANSSYSPDVFMGIVEGQESNSITKSSDREIEQCFVSEGDFVSVGTPLFSYKTDSLVADNTSLGFDIETSNLTIEDYNRQISKLQKDINNIKGQTDEDKIKREDLANQIEGIKTNIAIAQNSIEQTTTKIAENNKKIENSTVISTVDGVITKVADDTNPYTTDGSYITILASKEMRVRGQINEQNVWAINIDEPVTLRSRVDKDKTWKGKITKIDTESKQDNANQDSSNENQSTKYPFFVELDNSDGLMMGQHLYIELGQTSDSDIDFTNGKYIFDYYIAYDEDGNPFVWVDKNGKLAKQTVKLGDYFEDQMVYSVSGIDKNTMIAYPMEDYTEGLKTVSEGE